MKNLSQARLCPVQDLNQTYDRCQKHYCLSNPAWFYVLVMIIHGHTFVPADVSSWFVRKATFLLICNHCFIFMASTTFKVFR
jgi:hypothetical protein